MIDSFIAYIKLIVVEHGALGVFIATLIEQIIAPIPSPLVPMIAGFFLLPAQGFFSDVLWQSMLVIAIPVALGMTFSSLVIYLLGFWGGKPIIEKSRKWLGLNWEEVEKTKKKLDNSSRDELALFVLWLLPIVPSAAIAVLCGIIRYPVFKYIPIAISGLFLRTTVVSLIGWQAGEFYYITAKQIAAIESYLLIGFIFLVLVGVVFMFYKKRLTSNV